jgi:hypothetical protein
LAKKILRVRENVRESRAQERGRERKRNTKEINKDRDTCKTNIKGGREREREIE